MTNSCGLEKVGKFLEIKGIVENFTSGPRLLENLVFCGCNFVKMFFKLRTYILVLNFTYVEFV